MSIPFAQKMTIPFSASLSAYADVKSVADGCYYTDYDGIDDANHTADALFKISGAETIALEFQVGAVTDDFILGNLNTGALNGWAITTDTSKVRYLVFRDAGNSQALSTSTVIDGLFHKVVVVRDLTNILLYLDGVLEATTACVDYTEPTLDFYLGRAGASYGGYGEVNIRNFEHHIGATSNPTAWIPGDTTSLAGTTLDSSSLDGGTNFETGSAFTTVGAPTRTECP